MSVVRRIQNNADGSISAGNRWVIVCSSEKGLLGNWKAFAGFVDGKPTYTEKASELQVFRKWNDAFPLAKKLQEYRLDVDIRKIGLTENDGFYYLSPRS